MITKDRSKTEFCALCNRGVPEGAVVLRKMENGKILCLPCLVEIAELTIQHPVEVTKEDANRIKPDIDKQ